MKDNDAAPEPRQPEAVRSPPGRKALSAALAFGAVLCLIPLLPPVRNLLFALVNTRVYHRNAAAELFESRLSSLLSLPLLGLLACLFLLGCLHEKKIAPFLEKKANQRAVCAVILGALALLLSYVTVFSYQHGPQWLTSDHSSEMVLARLLAEENALVSRNWHYSTEIRMVYQTVFMAPLFKLLGGAGDWALIRALTILLNCITLVASYFFMMKQIRPLDKWTLLCALLLVLPTSQDYWSIVVFGGYYAFFIIQLFCALGLFLNLAGKRRRGRRAGSVFALFVLLSFLLGVQGVRGVLCVNIPLLLACAWAYREGPEEKPLLFPGACGFFAGAAGFVVNHLLHFVYSFHAFVNTLTDDLYANLFSKLGQSLVCLAGFFGFSAGSPLFSAAGILSVSSIFFTALFCLKTVRFARAKNAASAGAGSVGARGAGVAPERFVALFFLASALCNIFVFIVAGENVEARYFIPFMALYAPLLAVFFGRRARPPAKNAVAVILGVTLFFFAQSFLNFQSLAQSRGNENRKGYIDYLLENRLDFGFATFWNANITTELSNGRIEVAGLDPDGVEPGALRFLRLHNWLNPARVFVRALHPGPSFLLLTRAEWLLAQEAGRGFAQRAPDYEDDAYVVLRLPAAFIYDEVLDD